MPDEAIIVLRSAADMMRLRAAVANFQAVGSEAGRLMTAQARRAFREQRLGSVDWSPRYPGSPEPFVNVAGAVADFNAGRSAPLARRFQRTPAGVDTGRLRGSLSYEAGATQTVVGSTVPYASRIQFGGVSKQTLSADGRKNLAKFLRTKKGKVYRKRLGFLFSFPDLETNVVPRPFLGMTQTLAFDIVRLVSRHLGARAARPTGSGGAAPSGGASA